MSIETINPATGELIARYDEMPEKTTNDILLSVHKAQKQWQKTSFLERQKCFESLIADFKKNQNQYAKLLTQEMGKPITFSSAEIEKCQWVCEYYAKEAESLLAPRMIETSLKKSYVSYQPLGILFAIMPWNYPFWQVFRVAAPNLMAGNACVLSHAPISTGTALAIEQMFKEAGFPDSLFRAVIVDNDVARTIIQHKLTAGVTLTGSERAGRQVAESAGQALKKVVLELGGIDPYVVLSDADLDLAADQIVKSRMNNTGQVCISAKRIIVEKSICEALQDKIISSLQDYQMGDPMRLETNLGPMARADLREEVHCQVQKSIEQGAQLVCGGQLPQGPGFYYPPTLLADVKPGMCAFEEEVFGPVIAICPAKNDEEAIDLANNSRYGLSGVVFTKDIEKGEKIAREQIQVGTCFVNGMVSSDPRLPFGGIKCSGYGRELSIEGIHTFMNVKTIGIA